MHAAATVLNGGIEMPACRVKSSMGHGAWLPIVGMVGMVASQHVAGAHWEPDHSSFMTCMASVGM